MLYSADTCMAADGQAELEESWDALRPGRAKRLDWEGPNLDAIRDWAYRLGRGGPPVLSLEGPSKVLRSEVYRWMSSLPAVIEHPEEWVEKGVPQSLALGRGSWSLMWSLLSVEDFLIEDPLRELADQGQRFTEFFRAIWEVRFLYGEGRNVRSQVTSLIRWASDSTLFPDDRETLRRLGIRRALSRRRDRYDLMFFLLALARQNECVERAIFVFDGLEGALDQAPAIRRERFRCLLELTEIAEHWATLGSPTGILFGYSKQQEKGFKRFCPKLFGKVQEASALPRLLVG